jgi:glyoxylase-like metal-dependent hydrolase (beta-lactamase superfamily II)
MQVEHVTADADVFTANVYLVPGEVTTLVDAGAWPGVLEAVRRHVDSVDRVVLTHQDADHVAQLDAVVDAFDPDVYAHRDHLLRTHALADGDTVRIGDADYEAIHTPGHSDDHLVFASAATGAMFPGDVVVYEDGAFSGGSFGKTDKPEGDRDVLVDSLRTLLDRLPDGIRAMYPGHGPSYEGDDVRDVIETALARAERREPKYPDD